jgi:hypothetical protein
MDAKNIDKRPQRKTRGYCSKVWNEITNKSMSFSTTLSLAMKPELLMAHQKPRRRPSGGDKFKHTVGAESVCSLQGRKRYFSLGSPATQDNRQC